MINKCTNVICYNGGFCDHETKSRCTCLSEFTGNQCEIHVPKCIDIKCVNGGQCKESKFKAYCECPAGFGGDKCEIGKFLQILFYFISFLFRFVPGYDLSLRK